MWSDRSPDQTVQPGGRLTVTITASQYGDYAELIETLPEGFSFVSSGQPANVLVITESGRQIRIILLGPSRTVSYSMNASHVVGRHTISGLFRDEAKLESTVAGDDTVEVLGEAVAETGPSDSVATMLSTGRATLGAKMTPRLRTKATLRLEVKTARLSSASSRRVSRVTAT